MARSTFKVLFYVNGSKEKNGIYAGGSDIRVQSKYAFRETSPIGSTDGEAVGTSEYKGKKWLGQMPTW